MRIAAISDIHGNAVAFEAVLEDLRRQSPDVIVCLGDVVMRGPQPRECVDLLRSLNPLVTVRGNFDHLFTRWPKPDWQPTTYKEELAVRGLAYDSVHLSKADQAWLSDLPMEYSMSIADVHIELYHAGPNSLTRYTWPWAPVEELETLRKEPSTNLVLFGHMHHPFVRQATGFTVVNTGSIGLSFDGDNRASYAIIDIERQTLATQVRRVAYDVEAVIQVAHARSMPDVDLFEHAVRHAEFPYNAPLTGR